MVLFKQYPRRMRETNFLDRRPRKPRSKCGVGVLELLEPRVLLSVSWPDISFHDPNLCMNPEGDVAETGNPISFQGDLDVSGLLNGPTQMITPNPLTQTVAAGENFSIAVSYSTANPTDETLTGLGLRIHYDSSKLTWTSFSDVFATGKIAESSSPSADTADHDSDPSTDKYLTVAWADFSGNWPGNGNTPLDLYLANFTAAAGFTAGATSVNFSASSTAAGYTLEARSATINAFVPPVLSINNASELEGDSGTKALDFTVSLSKDPTSPVMVQVDTADGTATVADNDYTAVSGLMLTFNPGGPLNQTVTIDINGDTDSEANETFLVILSNATGATIADGQGVGTIQTDDLPVLTINDVSMLEENSGAKAFNFTVTLSMEPVLPVTVQVGTADSTATTADGDYSPVSGLWLTFNPGGSLTQTVSIDVHGDTNLEANETFLVTLSNATGATIGDGQGVGTIQNDDWPYLSIDDVSQSEGDSGTTAFDFTVTLSEDPVLPVSVRVNTADGIATMADNDYNPISGLVLTFDSGGPLTQTVTVMVNSDVDFEADETFLVTISNATNATVGDSQGVGTILNEDTGSQIITPNPQPQNVFPDSSFSITATYTTAHPLDETLTGLGLRIHYDSSKITWTGFSNVFAYGKIGEDSSPSEDTLDYDGNPLTDKYLTVTWSDLSGNWPGDGTTPLDLYVANFLAAPTFIMGYTIVNFSAGSTAAGYILETQSATVATQPPLPTVSIDDVSMLEGDSGVTAFDFTVTLSADPILPVTVLVHTADDTARAAEGDFNAISDLVLTFNPGGSLTQTVTVEVNSDTVAEGDETFLVNLSNITNATIDDNQGEGVIEGDDPEITVLLGAQTLQDGQSDAVDFGSCEISTLDTLQLIFTVRNDGDSSLSLTSLSVPLGFANDFLSGNLEPGESDSFTVVKDTSQIGTYNGTMVISSSDADESSFEVPIGGVVWELVSDSTKKTTVRFVDLDGGQTHVTRKGPGTIDIQSSSSPLVLPKVALSDTTEKTSLLLSGIDKTADVTVYDIETDGPLKLIKGKYANLYANEDDGIRSTIKIAGGVKKVMLNNLAGDLIAKGDFKSIVSKSGTLSGLIRSSGQIGTVRFHTIEDATLCAFGDIGKVISKNNIERSNLMAGYDVGSDGVPDPQGIADSTADDRFNAAGAIIAKIKVAKTGHFDYSSALAGVLPYDYDPLTGWTMLAPEGESQELATFGKLGSANLGWVLDEGNSNIGAVGLFAATEIGKVKFEPIIDPNLSDIMPDFQIRPPW